MWDVVILMGLIVISIFFSEIGSIDLKIKKKTKIPVLIIIMYISLIVIPFVSQPRVEGMLTSYQLTSVSSYSWIVLVICFWIMIWMSYRYIGAGKQIKKATHNMREPISLQVNGHYKDIRHPLYSYELILFTSFCCIFNSPSGILASILVYSYFYHTTVQEENEQLIPLFGEEYLRYKEKTRARFFNKVTLPLFFIPCILMIIGMTIYGIS